MNGNTNMVTLLSSDTEMTGNAEVYLNVSFNASYQFDLPVLAQT